MNEVIGLGLFAARDVAKDEYIFHEAPVMTATFNRLRHLNEKHEINQFGVVVNAHELDHSVRVAFPGVYSDLGRMPFTYDYVVANDLFNRLARNLVPGHGQLAGADIEKNRYEAWIGQFAKDPPFDIPETARFREVAADFIRQYAFIEGSEGAVYAVGRGSNLPLANTTKDVTANVYLLASLINHCCTPPVDKTTGKSPTEDDNGRPIGPNCAFRVGRQGLARFVLPQHIVVQANRDIREGEQLTWSYGKDRSQLGFSCMCDTCNTAPRGRCHVL